MSLLKNTSTIAGASVISQLIGAFSVWLISHKYNLTEVGLYALNYSIAVIGAQICTFASQLLIPKQPEEDLAQNVIFCLLQSVIMAIPYALLTAWLFHQNVLFLYLLSLSNAWILISENLLLRVGDFYFLILQRISVSIVVVLSIILTDHIHIFYWSWACGMILLTIGCIAHSFDLRVVTLQHLSPIKNIAFFRKHFHHISRVGSAETLAMANNNLPIILINFWFSALTAGYFSVVSRFCLAPVTIVGNAVRNTIFSKWSADFRNNTFNYQEYTQVRLLLIAAGVICTLGIFIFYPIVMGLGFSKDWINSIDTSRYMLPYLFPALAVSPLTVIELIFGSQRYFLRIQMEQLVIVLLAFVIVPWLYNDYTTSVIIFSTLTFIRYVFIYISMNKRAMFLRNKLVSL